MPSLEARKDGHQERLSPGLKKGQPHERWGEAGRAFQVEGTVCGRGKEGRGKWGHISGGDWKVAFTRHCTVRNRFARKSRKGPKDPLRPGESFVTESEHN